MFKFNSLFNLTHKKTVFLIILIYISKVFIDHKFFGYRLMSDTAGTYGYFQYYYNFFLEHKSFPEWIDFMDGGFPAILPMQIEGGIFQYFFILFGSIFKNPLFSFHLYCLSIFLFFCYGFKRHISINKGISQKNHNIIFFVTIIFFLFSTDFFYLNNMFLSSSIFLIIIFYIRKFFTTFKILNLIRASFIAIVMYFMFPHYANILNFIYIPFFIFLLSILLYRNELRKIQYKNKYFLYILFLILIAFTLFNILKYETSLYYLIASERSDNFKTTYEDFVSRRNGSIINFIGYLMYQEPFYNLYPVNLTSLGIFLLITIFYIKKKIIFEKNFLQLLLCLFIILIISFANNFYIFRSFFMPLIFNLPFVDYVRNILNSLFLFKPLLLVVISYSLNFLIENRKFIYSKRFYLTIVLMLILYTEFLFSVRFKSIDPYMWYGSILIFLLFVLFFYNYAKNGNQKIFILSIFVPMIFFHFFSLNSDIVKESNLVKYKNEIDKVMFDNNLYETDVCFKYDDINKFYNFIVPTRRAGNHFFLNTPEKPCGLNGFLRIRGSKKSHNFETFESYKSKDQSKKIIYFHSPNENKNIFNKKTFIDGIKYNVSSIYSDNFKVKKINPNKFFIESNNEIKFYKTKISYSNDWESFNIKNKKLLTKNSDGYLVIENNDQNLDFFIKYNNNNIKVLNIFFIFLSTISILILANSILFLNFNFKSLKKKFYF